MSFATGAHVKAAPGFSQRRDFIAKIGFNVLIHYNWFAQARSSVGERFLDTEEVGSSILPVPTIIKSY